MPSTAKSYGLSRMGTPVLADQQSFIHLTLYRHRMLSRGPAKSEERWERTAWENRGSPCSQHELMMSSYRSYCECIFIFHRILFVKINLCRMGHVTKMKHFFFIYITKLK